MRYYNENILPGDSDNHEISKKTPGKQQQLLQNFPVTFQSRAFTRFQYTLAEIPPRERIYKSKI